MRADIPRFRIVGRLISTLLLAFFSSSLWAIQPSMYDDHRVQEWSRLNMEGKYDLALRSIEADLLSSAPHPLARHAWITLERNHGSLDSAAKTVSPALRDALGATLTIALLQDAGDYRKMLHTFPADTAPDTVHDLWGLLWLAMAAREIGEHQSFFHYALAAGRMRPDYCFAARLTWESLSTDNSLGRDLVSVLDTDTTLFNTPFYHFFDALLKADILGEVDRIELVTEWLKEVPDDATALQLRSSYYRDISDYNQSLRDAESSTTLYSLRPQWIAQATALYALGKDGEAKALLSKGATISDPLHAEETAAKWSTEAKTAVSPPTRLVVQLGHHEKGGLHFFGLSDHPKPANEYHLKTGQ